MYAIHRVPNWLREMFARYVPDELRKTFAHEI